MTAKNKVENKGSCMPHLAERFEAAVSALVAEGSVKDRLVTAYLENLDDLESSDLPQSLRSKFESLHAALHSASPVGKEPSVRATIRKISRPQAGKHARTILSLYTDLTARGKRSTARGKRSAARGKRSEPLRVVNGKNKKAPGFISQGT